MSYRHRFFGVCGVLALGLLSFSSAVAQEKSAKDLIVGNWTLTIADHVRADGSKVPGFGPLPGGNVTFGADGRYSVQLMPNPQSTLVSSDQPTTTGGPSQGAAQGMVSYSGTYAIDESQKTLTLRVEQASLPNWSGTTQVGSIKFLFDDDLGWTNPKPLTTDTEFTATELIWRRAK